MLGKQRMSEGVVGQDDCMARSLWIKLDCLNPNLDLVEVRTRRKNA
jgi:hypothetical protein